MRMLGAQFGVEIGDKIEGNNGLKLQILVEDDENWFKCGNWFSSLWINDLIDVLKKVKRQVDNENKRCMKGNK